MGDLIGFRPDALEVTLFILGVYCVLAGLGIATGFQLGTVHVPSPTTRRVKVIVIAIGASLIVSALVITLKKPEWSPELAGRVVYHAHSSNAVKQVISDGADTYVLLEDRFIKAISVGREKTILDRDMIAEQIGKDLHIEEIAGGGGTIYIRDKRGHVWAYSAERIHCPQPVPQVPGEPMERHLVCIGNTLYVLTLVDRGTNTEGIVSVGDTLYVLKVGGQVWKIDTRTKRRTRDGKSELERIESDFQWVDDGTETLQITSAGTGLYILKASGEVWQFDPQRSETGPFRRLENCGPAKFIAADGITLYYINKESSNVYKCAVGERSKILGGIGSKIVARGGIAYILTNEGQIIRYEQTEGRLTRLNKKGEDAGRNNKDIEVATHGFFAVKDDGNVWRYTEFLSRRQ